jgi:hypothetical protein
MWFYLSKKLIMFNSIKLDIQSINMNQFETEIHKTVNFIVQKICNERHLLQQNFFKCIKGYHITNISPINQTLWEDVNSTIFIHSNIKVFNQSNGSHQSGMDISSSIGNISNKSCKYSRNKKYIDISSYRLTTVCNNKDYGIPSDFINEINKRKNFDYYSILICDEDSSTDFITYDWLFIPSNHYLLEPSSYLWNKTTGKTKSNIGNQTGWNTNHIEGSSMKIVFSMSSQLWLHIEMTNEIKKYIIASVTIRKSSHFDFISLFEKLSL